MSSEVEIWRLLAGLGLFLFGMFELEQALKRLAGRPFKVFLRQHTAHPVKAALAGTLSTAALQSSSVVSLIVLAFVGTDIVSLASGIGIVFGSNLGTTATGWIIATIGFKLDIESVALPFVAIGGFVVVWSRSGTRRAGLGHLVVGFGLMLMGLDFMKSSAIDLTRLFDPAALSRYPLVVFLFAGFLLTLAIQSSSATIMITLSALYADVIQLAPAAAVAIGADLGTTITAVLGALTGSAAKRRLAAAIVIFNFVTDMIALVFLKPLLYFVTVMIGMRDPLYALVGFHSLFNLIGLLLFLPIVKPLSRYLERRFTARPETLLRHIKESDRAVPEAAIENLNRETLRLIDQAIALNHIGFGLFPVPAFYDSTGDREGIAVFRPGADHEACYAEIKQLEGEILGAALALQSGRLEPAESARLGQLISSVRSAVHAAKSMKDIHHDLTVFRESVNDRFNAFFGHFRKAVREFYQRTESMKVAEMPSLKFQTLVQLKNLNEELHGQLHARIYQEIHDGELEEVEISTLLNVNRDVYASNQSVLASLADALLDAKAAEEYASIPVTA